MLQYAVELIQPDTGFGICRVVAAQAVFLQQRSHLLLERRLVTDSTGISRNPEDPQTNQRGRPAENYRITATQKKPQTLISSKQRPMSSNGTSDHLSPNTCAEPEWENDSNDPHNIMGFMESTPINSSRALEWAGKHNGPISAAYQ